MSVKQDIIDNIDNIDEDYLQHLYEYAYRQAGSGDRNAQECHGIDSALGFLAGHVDVEELPLTPAK